MPGTTKKFTPEIDAELYEEFVAVAKQNRQSQRQVLEQALDHVYGAKRIVSEIRTGSSPTGSK